MCEVDGKSKVEVVIAEKKKGEERKERSEKLGPDMFI
jgi:hypothetical protein